MANFNPPFASEAEKRFPTSDERQDGFECGPADMQLFDGLFHRIEAEIGEVIQYAGITQTDTDMTQLRKAIVALIAAALPEEGDDDIDTSQFVLLNQARARLPIFPEVDTFDGRMPVVGLGNGIIRIPGGISFLHRGIFPISTSQTDFNTLPSKIYHLRWTPADGFQLRDLADTSAYNPANQPETAVQFDSKYDDMLIARVITNSSNIATITNLSNKNVLSAELYNEFVFPSLAPQQVSPHSYSSPIEFNWSRTPTIALGQIGASGLGASVAGCVDFGVTGSFQNDFKRSETSRYNTRTALQAQNSGVSTAVITAQWQIVARA